MKRFMNTARVAALALAALTITIPVAAQGPRGHGGDPQKMAERQTTRLKEALSLTDEQSAQVKTILADNATQGAALREKYSSTEGKPSEEMRTEMKKLRDDTHAKIAKVLNADQLAKYDEMQKKFGRPGGPGHRGGKREQQQ